MAAAPTRTPYPPAAAFDVEMGVIHPNAVPDSRVESRAERAHRADAAIASLVDANPERLEDETFKIMSATEALVNAFTRLKPGIVRESDSSCMAKHIVVGGEIGLGRNINGETQIWPEGSYFWAGFGCTIDAIVKVRSDAAINSRTYKDICWFEVTHEQVAVIQKGSKTHVLGPGRYVLREPAKLMGIVNIKHLDKTESAVGYTEELMERKDAANRTVLDIQLKPVTMPSGRTAEAGGCVFVRSEAGFKAVAQAVDGTYRTFDGLELLRNGEKLIGFVDCQDYSRTTKTFQFLSNDNHTVDTRVKLDWRITKPTLWMQCKGAFSDPFDALEDKVQSGVRDEIGKKTYDELIKQKDEGFDGFEKALGPGLIAFAESKGFLLIDVQIREIKAPFIEIRNAELARKQAEANENQLEAKRAIDQQRLIDEKAKNAKIAELDREKTAAEQKASIDGVEHSRELARVKAQEARATQQVRDAAEREKIKLEAELQQAQIEASRVKTVAEGQAAAVEAEAKGRAAARIVAARAEADSLKLVAEAEAEGSKARGTAEAQRIQQVAEALRNNPAVLQLELARLNVDISNGASKAYGTGFATLTPNERQELVRMANGYNPLVSPIVVGGVVGAQSTAAAAANGRT